MQSNEPISFDELKQTLLNQPAHFFEKMIHATKHAQGFDDLLRLSVLRRKAESMNVTLSSHSGLKVALLGGYALQFQEILVQHQLLMKGFAAQIYTGEYDSYVNEILDESSGLYQFKPDVVWLMPSEKSRTLAGTSAGMSNAQLKEQADSLNEELLSLCRTLHERTHAEIVLSTQPLQAEHDMGAYTNKSLSSERSFKKYLNLELGLAAPSYVHILDLEFLQMRMGGLAATDWRGWFESKQIGSPDFIAASCTEFSHIAYSLKNSSKKVLVLDLDNTLWGGVIGDDGLEGIELGDTSPRGEAFKRFQKEVLSLKDRGVLLAVCSKNNMDKAVEPFEKHSEMILKRDHIVSFKANWQPKPENIRAIAEELNLGLDSFVFVDDNPAEIEIVRQFLPEVETIWMGDEPAEFVRKLKDSRFFEPLAVTSEDSARTHMYIADTKRKELKGKVANISDYLRSLEMKAVVSPFQEKDAQRIAQLINKSNQFNLTTRRKTEAEVASLSKNKNFETFTLRLADRFGDHGLIAVLILDCSEPQQMRVETWLMSCRVLSRQVEELALNEMFRLARARGAKKVVGQYLPTSKNAMVAGLFLKFGFAKTAETDGGLYFEKDVESFKEFEHFIEIERA